MDFCKIDWPKKKRLLHYWLNLLHYREVLLYWLIFITLSGSITLSGVYYIIGAKCYNWYISRYSSTFYGGHFENGYSNPNGHIKRILAKKSLLHYWLNLLHYREVLHYWLIFITLSGSITISGVYYIIGAKYYYWHISRYSSNINEGHYENSYPNPTGHIKWILAR